MMEPLGGHQPDPTKTGRSKWKLFGCIGLAVLIPIVMTVGIVALVLGGIYYGSKSTEEFECAMSEIQKHRESVELLGEPIKDGLWILPNIEISGPRRDVSFNVTVSGPKSSGTLSVISYRDGFRSDFMMYLEADGKRVDIYKGSYPCK